MTVLETMPAGHRSIDEMRPLRVVCIGAGISGIITAIRFPEKIPNLSLQIYEKNTDIGGTWHENVYPGCACDIPAHTYQLSFEPNHEWSQFYASAPEIKQYWKKVTKKYACMKYIKLRHKVTEARWDGDQSKWLLQVHDISTGSTFSDSCDVLISATGALNEWKWPAISGLHDFKGKLMHSANWDETYNYSNQRVAVIGSGSSAIQIVPGIQKSVQHIDHYVRGKTWIATPFAPTKMKERGSHHDNYSFSEEEIRSFKENPDVYKQFRKDIELELQSGHGITMRGSKEQAAAKAAFTEHMQQKVARKPFLMAQLLPSFPPACRRLTPGPGYLEALSAENVDVISEPITKIVADGIVTSNGTHRAVDTIICATGFDTSFVGRFPLIGMNKVLLSEKWKDVPATYMSLATDGFPNYFIYLGPASGLGTGNLLILLERLAEYFIQCIAKMQRDGIREMGVKKSAVDRFVSYSDKYFEQTIFSLPCRSWYKGGKEDGRINALWPGSSLHAMCAMAYPRWEDYDYVYINDDPMVWFGDGWTVNERNQTIDVNYLDYENIDFPYQRQLRAPVNGEIKRYGTASRMNGSGLGK